MADREAAQRRRRLVVIGVPGLLLVAMAVAVTLGVSMNQSDSGQSQPKGDKSHISDSMKAVTDLCRPTDYKKECEDSLKSEAGNKTDPKDLIKIAFNITIRPAGESLRKTRLIHGLQKDPKSKMALDSCMHLMALSIDEFRKPVQNIGSFDLTGVEDMLMNLKVWISGAITYQQTCLDGFQNTTSPACKQMQDVLKLTMRYSSNIFRHHQ